MQLKTNIKIDTSCVFKQEDATELHRRKAQEPIASELFCNATVRDEEEQARGRVLTSHSTRVSPHTGTATWHPQQSACLRALTSYTLVRFKGTHPTFLKSLQPVFVHGIGSTGRIRMLCCRTEHRGRGREKEEERRKGGRERETETERVFPTNPRPSPNHTGTVNWSLYSSVFL